MKQNNNTKNKQNTFSHWVSAQQQPRSPRDRGHDHEKTNHKATRRKTRSITRWEEKKSIQKSWRKCFVLPFIYCLLYLYFNLIILFDFTAKFNALYHTFSSHFIAIVGLSVFVCFVLLILFSSSAAGNQKGVELVCSDA